MQIQRFSLYKQIELFQGTQILIRNKIGKEETDKFFKEARYVVALGSNDFINNYLMPVYSDSWTYNDETFIPYLIGTLQGQLKVYLIYTDTSISFVFQFLLLIIILLFFSLQSCFFLGTDFQSCFVPV